MHNKYLVQQVPACAGTVLCVFKPFGVTALFSCFSFEFYLIYIDRVFIANGYFLLRNSPSGYTVHTKYLVQPCCNVWVIDITRKCHIETQQKLNRRKTSNH